MEGLDARVARLLDDISDPARATEAVAALGAEAVEPLWRYLQGPPQSVPQARRLAVRLLGLIGGDDAHQALRRVLFHHVASALDPVLALSEHVVKNEAVKQLALAGRCDFAEDILAAFRRDHLPAAAQALAQFRVTAAIPDLVAALESDILAERAGDALREFGPLAEAGLARSLDERHGASAGEARVSRHRRIQAALLLAEMGTAASVPPLLRMFQDANPVVRAAAGLALCKLDPAHLAPERIRAIVEGGLSPEWRVRVPCQRAASTLGAVAAPAAIDTLATEAVLDLYDVPYPVPREGKRWLVSLLLESMPGDDPDAISILFRCDETLLAEGVMQVRDPHATAAVRRIGQHPSPRVREAAAHALGRLGGVGAAGGLLQLLNDRVRRVRLAAAHALRALATGEGEQVWAAWSAIRSDSPWLLRARFRWALRGSGRDSKRGSACPRHNCKTEHAECAGREVNPRSEE